VPAVQSRIECTLIIEHEEPGVTCRQTLEGVVEFSVLGLGKLAEHIVADNLEKVYSGIPAIVERYRLYCASRKVSCGPAGAMNCRVVCAC
jgi:hypothetical protein